MSYLTQWRLTYDDPFVSRCRACQTQQAAVQFGGVGGANGALADAILRGEPGPLVTFQSMLAATPGFADKLEPDQDGNIDSSVILDAEILAAVQAEWPAVAALYFDDTGAPITTTKGAP